MKKPDANSNENAASPGNENKKKAVSGAAIDSRPVPSGGAAPGAGSAPVDPIESKLVGTASGPDAAAPKASAPGASPISPDSAKPDAAKPGSSVPPVAKTPAKPETVKADTKKAEPAKTDAAKTASDPVKPEPVKAAPEKPAPTGTSTATSAPRVVETRKGGFMPTVLGGVIAAGLGAGAAFWAIPHLPAAWQPGIAETTPNEAEIAAAREAGIEAAKAEIQAQADAFSSRAAEAGADAARQALADAAPQSGGDAAAMQAQADKLAALEKTVSDLAARPAATAVVSGEDGAQLQQLLDDLNGRIAAQQQRIDALSAREAPAADPAMAERMEALAAQAETLQTQIATAADEAEKRIAAAEEQAASLQENAEAANRRAVAASAAAALQAAMESGGARDQALADLRAAGIEPAPVLAGDVPTLAQLRAEFPAAARNGLAAALKEAPGETGALGAIRDFLRVQTGARSVEPREGSDPDAILSRADAAVTAGDIQSALTEIGALPQSGQDAMADWTARAQTWTEANAALADLAAGSM